MTLPKCISAGLLMTSRHRLSPNDHRYRPTALQPSLCGDRDAFIPEPKGLIQKSQAVNLTQTEVHSEPACLCGARMPAVNIPLLPQLFRTQSSNPKFAIFLMGPESTVGVDVRLRLTRGWRFGERAPEVRPVVGAEGSSVYWELALFVDGESPSMLDFESNQACDYLLWEAWPDPAPFHVRNTEQPEAEADTRSSQGTDCIQRVAVHSSEGSMADRLDISSHEADREIPAPIVASFIISRPPLTPENALVLPKATFLPYLEQTLYSLGLNLVLCAAFTALWLPCFETIDAAGRDIAFRFIEQTQLAQWASLEIDADAVARVFLVFRGVDTSPNGLEMHWVGRRSSLEQADSVSWAERTGIDRYAMMNTGLLRAVELGAWRWDYTEENLRNEQL